MHAPALIVHSEGSSLRREGGGRRSTVLLYLALHLSLLAAFWIEITLQAVLVGLVLLQIRGFCQSAGYHRLLAHHSFRTSRVFQFLLAAGGCTALRGGPLWWACLHRHHHRHSDQEVDTFRPAQGILWSYFGWLISGRFDKTDYNLVRDLARYPELCWLNRWWLLPSLPLALGTYLIGGWELFVVGFCWSSLLLLHSMSFLDAFNHLVGRQRYETGDDSRNNFVLSVLTMGEGWHNNHHHYQSSANFGFFWFEVDGTYSLLRLLARCGIIWDVRTAPASVLTSKLRQDPGEASGRMVTEAVAEGQELAPALEGSAAGTRGN